MLSIPDFYTLNLTHKTPICLRVNSEGGRKEARTSVINTSHIGLALRWPPLSPPCHTMKMETSPEGTAPGSFLPIFLTLWSYAATQLELKSTLTLSPLLQFQFLFEESKTFRRMQKTLASGNAGCDKLSCILSITQGTEGVRGQLSMDSGFFVGFFPLPLQLRQEAS